MTVFGWTLVSKPSTPSAPASIEWNPQDTVGMTTNPFTLQQQTYDWQSSCFEGTAIMPPIDQDTALAWEAFLLGLRGTKNVFQMGDPLRTSPKGTALGTPVVNGQN